MCAAGVTKAGSGAVGGASRGQAGIVCTADPAIYELTLRPWELMCSPLDRGPFCHRIAFFKTPKFVLYHECYASAVRVQGLAPANTLAVSVPLHLGPRATYWKTPASDGCLPSMLPGPLDVVFDAGHCHLIALIDLELVRQGLPEVLHSGLIRGAETHFLWPSAPAIAHFTAWTHRVLKAVEAFPNVPSYSAPVRAIEQDLLQCLMGLAEGMAPQRPPPRPLAQKLGLERALAYLRDRESEQVTMTELCQAAGVSARTLAYAFRSTLDISPLGFLRRRRFHGVRQQLLTSSPDTARVADIALDQGFYELGRFASEYRRLFGERPSETLRRPCPTKGNENSLLVR